MIENSLLKKQKTIKFKKKSQQRSRCNKLNTKNTSPSMMAQLSSPRKVPDNVIVIIHTQMIQTGILPACRQNTTNHLNPHHRPRRSPSQFVCGESGSGCFGHKIFNEIRVNIKKVGAVVDGGRRASIKLALLRYSDQFLPGRSQSLHRANLNDNYLLPGNG